VTTELHSCGIKAVGYREGGWCQLGGANRREWTWARQTDPVTMVQHQPLLQNTAVATAVGVSMRSSGCVLWWCMMWVKLPHTLPTRATSSLVVLHHAMVATILLDPLVCHDHIITVHVVSRCSLPLMRPTVSLPHRRCLRGIVSLARLYIYL
jgi:hypothetical protein